MSPIGCFTPISLFTAMTLTRHVSLVIARCTSSAVTSPFFATGRYVTL